MVHIKLTGDNGERDGRVCGWSWGVNEDFLQVSSHMHEMDYKTVLIKHEPLSVNTAHSASQNHEQHNQPFSRSKYIGWVGYIPAASSTEVNQSSNIIKLLWPEVILLGGVNCTVNTTLRSLRLNNDACVVSLQYA